MFAAESCVAPVDLERDADRLLAQAPTGDGPVAHTERAMAQRAARALLHARSRPDAFRGAQSRRDELAFLATLAGVPDALGLAVRMWYDGWTFGCVGQVLGVSDRWAGALVRSTLERCADLEPVTFRGFTRRGAYRAPSHSPARSLAHCPVCGAPFYTTPHLHRFCTDACRRAQTAPRRPEKGA